jgi:hypothetical protein
VEGFGSPPLGWMTRGKQPTKEDTMKRLRRANSVIAITDRMMKCIANIQHIIYVTNEEYESNSCPYEGSKADNIEFIREAILAEIDDETDDEYTRIEVELNKDQLSVKLTGYDETITVFQDTFELRVRFHSEEMPD